MLSPLSLLLLLALATATSASEQVAKCGAHASRSQRITSSLSAAKVLLASLSLWTLVRRERTRSDGVALASWRRRLGGHLVRLTTRRGIAADLPDGAIVRLIDATAKGIGDDGGQA